MGGKFAREQSRKGVDSPIKTTGQGRDTYEGGTGYARDAKSDLFLLAASNMVGEDTFYEGAAERDTKFRDLIWQVTREDEKWMRGFIAYLRNDMLMRSASVVAAAEYVAAAGSKGRDVVSSALQRADEPAELLSYWHLRYKRTEPMPIKRGISDALNRLYNEYAALRYDGAARGWRMGDVIERVHARPKEVWRSKLFKYLLGVRFEDISLGDERLQGLDTITGFKRWEEAGHPLPDDGGLPTGVSWETLSTYHKMDARAWEAVIPQMGYMALLRNLRNFEQAEVKEELLQHVAMMLADADQVAKSKQFPFRFLSAYNALDSHTFSQALERALNHSVANVPVLKGSTLIMVDVSGSMFGRLSGKSKAELWQVASLFGAALAKRAEKANLVVYSDEAASMTVGPKASILRVVEEIRSWPYANGGTQTWRTLDAVYNGEDRVIILTDEQAFAGAPGSRPPLIYTFNLAGYDRSGLPSGEKGRYTFGGGLTDKSFIMLKILEAHRNEGWPWEAK